MCKCIWQWKCPTHMESSPPTCNLAAFNFRRFLCRIGQFPEVSKRVFLLPSGHFVFQCSAQSDNDPKSIVKICQCTMCDLDNEETSQTATVCNDCFNEWCCEFHVLLCCVQFIEGNNDRDRQHFIVRMRCCLSSVARAEYAQT